MTDVENPYPDLGPEPPPIYPADTPTEAAAVVTATPVVFGVVIAVGVIVLAVVIAAAWLSATDAPPLPGELMAIAPTGVGILGALLAGTLTKKA